MTPWPPWWEWELELSPHLLKRMQDRDFNEADLRVMLEDASGYRKNDEPDRWVIETARNRQPWEIVVEPDEPNRVLVVVTAFPVESFRRDT